MHPLEEVIAYKCGNCGQPYMDDKYAIKCCQTKACEGCGIELPHKYYYTVCDLCRESAKRLRATEKLTLDEYIEKYPGNGVFTSDYKYYDIDDFCEEIEDWLSYNDEGEPPEYVYGADRCFVRLNAENIMENLEEQVSFEDDVQMFYQDAHDEMESFCTE